MSFYRTILAAVAAAALVAPVFADDTMTNTTATDSSMTQTSGDTSSSMSTTTNGSKVNVNKASAKDLMKVKGLNASKARAIVAYRKKHGDFKTVDDLMNVKGFKKLKPDTVKEIQDQLTLD